MKHINDESVIGYDKDGQEILAERLQIWAYNQLAAAPELLEACKEIKALIDDTAIHNSLAGKQAYPFAVLINQTTTILERIIQKAEGRP